MKDHTCISNKANLRFMPSGSIEGFVSKSVASDSEANPNIIVRELVQNSIDAASVASREEAVVEFRFDEFKVEDIPGLDEFKTAFKAAKKTHEKQLEPAEAQIERIEKSLNSDTVPVLHVIDNGVGLSRKRMNALLGDGVTNKTGDESEAAGSFGVGHFTAFPASDMQYMLYSGVDDGGIKTMSGHAILASHFHTSVSGDNVNSNHQKVQGEKELFGKDGFYITGVSSNDIYNRYEFPEGRNVSPALSSILDGVREDYSSGANITFLGFNYFRDEESKSESKIFEAVALSFFPIILSGTLRIRVRRDSYVRELDREMTKKILEKVKRNTRYYSGAVNGRTAYSAFLTITCGDQKIVESRFGNIKLYFREAEPQENTQISLFRSGMFITSSVPFNERQHFGEYQRFNVVILVEPTSDNSKNGAFQLVRRSEGEKHRDLDVKRLPSGLRSDFLKLFKEIQEKIKDMATIDDGESYSPDDFMLIDLFEESNSKRNYTKAISSQYKRRFVPTHSTSDDFRDRQGERSNGSNRKRKRSIPDSTKPKRSGKRPPISAVARRKGNMLDLRIDSKGDISKSFLRVTTDQGSDESCTAPLTEPFLKISAAYCDSSEINSPKELHLRNQNQEIVLEKLTAGFSSRLTVHFLENIPDNTVFKIDVIEEIPHESK